MKRKQPAPTGVDDRRKRSQINSREITVASNTKDVPLSTVFDRILNDITKKNFPSRFQPQIAASNPTNKQGV